MRKSFFQKEMQSVCRTLSDAAERSDFPLVRILITQRALRRRGGSEMVTIEVALELRGRGHDIAVFSPQVGDLAEILVTNGVWVKSRLNEIPWIPEVIHGQHHLQAIAAMTHFDATPAIYHCHGVTPWVERPPVHPRIRYYVMMCEWMEARMEPEFGIPKERVTTISNFVNARRFSRIRAPAERPRRAVLFGNIGFPTDQLVSLEAACAQEGITLEHVGEAYGNPQPRPEIFLLDYDLVFAIGKCAIEALACGCAVITVIPGQAGQLVTTQNLAKWAFSNFSPRYFTSAAQISSEWLHEELNRYSASEVSATSAELRAKHHLVGAVDRMEALYEKTIREHSGCSNTQRGGELAAYLEPMSLEVDTMWLRNQELESQLERQEARWKRTVAHLQRGMLARRSLKSIERMAQKFFPEL